MLAKPKPTIGNLGWRIASYSIGIKRGVEDYAGPYTVNGAAFSPQAVAAIKARTGRKGTVHLESTKAIGQDGQKRTLSPMTIIYTS